MSDSRHALAVAVDGSPQALKALHTAADLARATGRELVLIYVYPHTSTSTVGAELDDEEFLTDHRDRSARAVFDAAIAQLGSDWSDPKKILLWGNPAEEIIEFMRQNPGVHLVMGRRGLSRIKSLLLGSVSDKVLRHGTGLVTLV